MLEPLRESLYIGLMEIKRWEHGQPASMQLAKAPAFRLGFLQVDPSIRTVRAGARIKILEPRVMRVLVALGKEPGAVLSRDDLIELCWDGQIVSDNAINRAISQLRRALEQLADGAVRLETIAKVGFHIVVDGAQQTGADLLRTAPAETMEAQAAALTAQPRMWTRRAAAGGIVTVAAGAALAYAAWDRTAPYEPDPRALDLYSRGQILLMAWELGSIRQAIAFNKQAVAIDPDFADAWGALAIAYIHGLDGLTAEAKAAYPQLVRSAAKRALALNPDQVEAHFALAIPFPHYRRWLDHEQRLRSLVQRFPGYWYGHTQLGILLADVGRYEEAIVFFRRAREIDSMAPMVWGRLAAALQQAGRDQEADLVLDEALALWPEHVHLWVTRSSNFIEGRRFAEAIAFSRDAARRPMNLPERTWQRIERIATALASGERRD